jgi:hypothetical protein
VTELSGEDIVDFYQIRNVSHDLDSNSTHPRRTNLPEAAIERGPAMAASSSLEIKEG